MNCEVDTDHLIDMFGEHFASNPSQFRFRSGDIILIKALVEHVREIVDKNGRNTGLNRFKFACKRKKPKRKKNQPRNVHEKIIEGNVQHVDSKQIDMLKERLYERVCKCLEIYSAHRCIEIELYALIDRSIVDVQMDKTSQQIYGTIVCIICREKNERKNKPKRVYYDGESESWIISNFQTHLKRGHKLKPLKTESQLDDVKFDFENHIKPISMSDEKNGGLISMSDEQNGGKIDEKSDKSQSDSCYIVEESYEIVSVETNDDNAKTDQEDWLYTQLSHQITGMIEAVLSNGDMEERVSIQITENTIYLTVARIPGNGNCLFGAVAHQLYRHSIHSEEHKTATNAIRAEVVEHILKPENFSSYEFALQDRVYDMKKPNEIQNMTSECELYVRNVLSRDGSWGGHESIQAISDMYRINIVIFNEADSCVLQTNNQDTFERTIAIAYRLAYNAQGEIQRNHYDSVSDMESNDVWAASNFLMQRMK